MANNKVKRIRGVFEKEPGSGIWWVQWFDTNGKRHREKAGTRAAAVALKAKRTTDRLEARKIPETLKYVVRARFSELCADALINAQHENGESAQSNLRGVISALTPDFGSRDASSIATLDLLIWLRARAKAKGWADGTYNHYIVQLRVIYRIGQESGKVEVNPAGPLKKKQIDNDLPRYLTPEEAERLEAVLRDRWPQHMTAYLFARHTGLRAGAQFSLKWTQVDMVRRTLTLPPRKNSKYRKLRVLPLNSVAYHALVEMRERSACSPLVFAEYHAGPSYLSEPAYWFPEIVEAAGIQDFTWHSLRHDFASQLVMRGINLKAVQELMCHATLKQTAKYAALAPEHLQSAVECLATVAFPLATISADGVAAVQNLQKRSATKTATNSFETASVS
jgi:site-specific recombinase XerD